jgi:hypothetical protein
MKNRNVVTVAVTCILIGVVLWRLRRRRSRERFSGREYEFLQTPIEMEEMFRQRIDALKNVFPARPVLLSEMEVSSVRESVREEWLQRPVAGHDASIALQRAVVPFIEADFPSYLGMRLARWEPSSAAWQHVRGGEATGVWQFTVDACVHVPGRARGHCVRLDVISGGTQCGVSHAVVTGTPTEADLVMLPGPPHTDEYHQLSSE